MTAQSTPFDVDVAWDLHPQVVIRPESFGGLAYHFGTRRLTFLKSPELRTVVESLDAHPCVRDACTAAGIGEHELPACTRALTTLAETDMIVARGAA